MIKVTTENAVVTSGPHHGDSALLVHVSDISPEIGLEEIKRAIVDAISPLDAHVQALGCYGPFDEQTCYEVGTWLMGEFAICCIQIQGLMAEMHILTGKYGTAKGIPSLFSIDR